MLGVIIFILVLFGSLLSIVIGYLILKIRTCQKKKMNINGIMNRNISARRKSSRKRKKKSSSKSKRKKSLLLKKKKKLKSNRRKKKRKKIKKHNRKSRKRRKPSDSSDVTGSNKNSPLVTTTKPELETLKPVNTKEDHAENSLYHIDENHMSKRFIPIARSRYKSSHNDQRRSECIWTNSDDTYSTLFETMNYIDTVKNVMPYNENDATNFSKYEYELNYNEEHLFRC